jgi:hypothetical protein
MQRQKSQEIAEFDHLDRVFPIVDVPSAQLMKVKARCVFGAGAITAAQLAEIDRRADETIGEAASLAPDSADCIP